MKRFSPTLCFDNEYGEPEVAMIENSSGAYVLADDAFREAGYVWDFRTATWIKPLTTQDDSATVQL